MYPNVKTRIQVTIKMDMIGNEEEGGNVAEGLKLEAGPDTENLHAALIPGSHTLSPFSPSLQHEI
jgi:hypothetical protein